MNVNKWIVYIVEFVQLVDCECFEACMLIINCVLFANFTRLECKESATDSIPYFWHAISIDDHI